MFRPFPLFIGLRYTRAKRRNHFISFISLVSMLGIALGVAVLITVLSVMNGFDHEIQSRIFSLASQVTVTSVSDKIEHWQPLAKRLEKAPEVKAAAPFVMGQGMLTHDNQASPVLVSGILPNQEKTVSTIQNHLIEGKMTSLKPGEFNIVLGRSLATELMLGVGDKVLLLIPKFGASPLGAMPRYKRFTVSGVFHVPSNPGFEKGIAYINLSDAQTLYELGKAVSGIRLRVANLFSAPRVANELLNTLPPEYIVRNWTQQYGAFFKAIQMEKTMMFVILILIIAVAAFNLVSTLMMVVTDKRAEIAILRTLGARPRSIMGIFMVQGCVVGLVGTLLGVIVGILLALNVTGIVNWIQRIFHVDFISSSVYFINYLPSRLEWSDVWHIGSVAIILSLLATLYPAWKASRTQPAEALRYE